jgi:hypothetical protein
VKNKDLTAEIAENAEIKKIPFFPSRQSCMIPFFPNVAPTTRYLAAVRGIFYEGNILLTKLMARIC